MGGESRKIHAAENVFDIIESLANNDGMTLGELGDELDLTKGTVHAYMATMIDRGFVTRDRNTYTLTFRFLEYAEDIRQDTGIMSHVRDALQEIVNRTDGIAWFVVEENGYAVFADKARSVNHVQPYGSIGKYTTLHDIAGGKAILAHLPEERVGEIIADKGLPAKTENTITDPESLYEALEDVRERGYALNDGENVEGWRAVASPILQNGEVLGALAASEPEHRMAGDRFTERIPEIVTAASTDVQLAMRST